MNLSANNALLLPFTRAGLEALGLPSDQTRGFGNAFSHGMRNRPQILGDVGDSARNHWHWGGEEDVHVLVISYAASPADLNLWQTVNKENSGLTEIYVIDSEMLEGGTDHFGFRDGISQPYIDGIDTTAASTLGSRFDNRVRTGEFILGYPNEGAHFADCPSVPEALDQNNNLRPFDMSSDRRSLGHNGSYLVLRQIEQLVDRFNELVNQVGAGDQELFKAKLIGRWPSGAPLVLAPNNDNNNLDRANDFGYHATDRWGYRCPLGAHIRRANPRDALANLDQGQSAEAAVKSVNTRRIIRRGRPYKITDDNNNVIEKGLMFACINASIDQQFEFVQQRWINGTSFSDLQAEVDPLVGTPQDDSTGIFTIHRPGANRTLQGLEPLVRVRGGSYFFLPSIRAVRFLIALPNPPGAGTPDSNQGSSSTLPASSLNNDNV